MFRTKAEVLITLRIVPLALCLPLIACDTAAPPRPMDEVPQQAVRADGTRQYSFQNGCAIVLDATRAVVRTEAPSCQLHHRDIALLYASGD